MTLFAAADERRTTVNSGEGLFTRMLRLWIEHHQRMIDLGLRPL